jgi:luciferase family oxidoreductase group 1
LIAAAASATGRIKLGAGGIMVPNHAPLHVVEVFRTLEALAPGRIDLGLGRAPGTDPVASAALRRSDTEVNSQLAELLAFEQGGFPASHPFSKVEPMPSDVPSGTLWMLGSTLAGASIAAQLGVPYAFAGHFAMAQAVAAIKHYKAKYEPSANHPKPYAMLAVTAVCAETDEQATRLAAPLRVAIVKNRTGRRAPIVSIAEALEYQFSDDETRIAEEFFTGAVIGSPAKVAAGLKALQHETGADEIMLSALLPDLGARTRSLQLIAEALA